LNTINSKIKSLRNVSANHILAFLPFTLFFPVGLMYAGVIFFLIAYVLCGNFKEKWQLVSTSPMLFPAITLSIFTIFIALIQQRDAHEFGSSFFHYQSYLFLLLFVSIGTGAWQQKAIHFLFLGAMVAASIFYLDAMGVLPPSSFVRSYQIYEGNKSILIALLLAITSAWMMHEWRIKKDRPLLRAFVLIYVVAALFLFAKSRTAMLLFFLLSSFMVLRNFRFGWKLISLIAGCVVILAFGVQHINKMDEPVTCLTKEMKDIHHLSGTEIAINRAICTVHQIRNYKNNQTVTADGMRLELFSNTLEMALEKPLLGHGIGNWLAAYKEKAKGSISEEMTTPHNDYLLYFFELGIFGVFALLSILVQQLIIAKKMITKEYHEKAMLLAMLTTAILFSSMFNAILRDGLFSMAMMILLAIPLAGVTRQTLKK
jgi:O-antigen ligase